MISQNIKRLKRSFDGNYKLSQRRAASRFCCDQSYIPKALKNKTKIRCYKKTKSPEYTEAQIVQVKKQCLWLNRNSLGLDFVIDDEHYFTLSKSQLAGNKRYYTSDKVNEDAKVNHYLKKI